MLCCNRYEKLEELRRQQRVTATLAEKYKTNEGGGDGGGQDGDQADEAQLGDEDKLDDEQEHGECCVLTCFCFV